MSNHVGLPIVLGGMSFSFFSNPSTTKTKDWMVMTAFSRRNTLTLTGTALAAAALLTAGCGPIRVHAGSGPGSGSGGSGSGQATAGSGGAASTAPPSSGATAAPDGAGSGASGSGTPGTAQSDCTSDRLAVTVGNSEGAAGSTIVPIVFTNKSSGTCSIQGFPGVSLANSGGPIGAPAIRHSSRSSEIIALAPGAKAIARLKVADAQNYPSSTCQPDTATFLQVYPPNLTQASDVPFQGSGCRSKSVKLLHVRPVVQGAGG